MYGFQLSPKCRSTYCEWCSLALGQQEKAVTIGDKPYHDRCAETAMKQKGKVIEVKFGQVFTPRGA